MNSRLSVILAIAGLAGCAANRAPDVSARVRDSLKQAGLTNVTVSQNRDRGVVTLGGTVNQDQQKSQAQQIAQPLAANQVVANEIAVVPAGNESAVKNVDSDLDKGIQANLDAALAQNNVQGVHHTTKNGVVTLTGDVATNAERSGAERISDGIPNVQQVVNEITVKNQWATTSTPRNPAR